MATVTLPADVYYRLRYLQAAAEATAYKARCDVAAAEAAFTHALREAGAAHGFDPSVDHAWDDTHTALVAPTTEKGTDHVD